jgi:hypothetical protein
MTKFPLNVRDRARAQKLTDTLGEVPAAAQLYVNRATLARALAGRPVLASIAQCMSSRLRELASRARAHLSAPGQDLGS